MKYDPHTAFNLMAPSGKGESVDISVADYTPSSGLIKAIWVGSGGDLVVEDQDGTELTFKNVPTGTFVDFSASKIKTTTTCADMVAVLTEA